MSTDQTSLANTIRSAAAAIDPAKVSVSKWRSVEAIVAEALRRDPEKVYGATISKAGNLSVRISQSRRGRTAPVVLLMCTGEGRELERCVEAAKRHCSDRHLALVFAQYAQGWVLLAILKPQGAPVPPELAAAYPTASVGDL